MLLEMPFLCDVVNIQLDQAGESPLLVAPRHGNQSGGQVILSTGCHRRCKQNC